MKIRIGFVSNSSSSSFILVSDKKAEDIEIIIKVNLKNFIYEDNSIEDIAEELGWDYIFKDYTPNNKEYIKTLKLKNEIEAAIKEGKNVYMGGFSTEEGGIGEALTYPEEEIQFVDNESTKLLYHSGMGI